MPVRHSSTSDGRVLTGVQALVDLRERAALVHAHDEVVEALAGRTGHAVTLLPWVPRCPRGREAQPVGPADEAAPALRAVVEVVEEVLEHPGQGARLVAQLRRLRLGEGGGVEREAAVLEVRSGRAGEEVLQRRGGQLGLDQRPRRIEDEVLAVVEDRLLAAEQEPLDGDHPVVLHDGELLGDARPGGDDARLEDARLDVRAGQVAHEVVQVERRGRELRRLHEGAAAVLGDDHVLAHQLADGAAHRHGADGERRAQLRL